MANVKRLESFPQELLLLIDTAYANGGFRAEMPWNVAVTAKAGFYAFRAALAREAARRLRPGEPPLLRRYADLLQKSQNMSISLTPSAPIPHRQKGDPPCTIATQFEITFAATGVWGTLGSILAREPGSARSEAPPQDDDTAPTFEEWERQQRLAGE